MSSWATPSIFSRTQPCVGAEGILERQESDDTPWLQGGGLGQGLRQSEKGLEGEGPAGKTFRPAWDTAVPGKGNFPGQQEERRKFCS